MQSSLNILCGEIITLKFATIQTNYIAAFNFG